MSTPSCLFLVYGCYVTSHLHVYHKGLCPQMARQNKPFLNLVSSGCKGNKGSKIAPEQLPADGGGRQPAAEAYTPAVPWLDLKQAKGRTIPQQCSGIQNALPSLPSLFWEFKKE